jgi:hypothetical protein
MKEISVIVAIKRIEPIQVPNDMDLDSTEAIFYIQNKLDRRLKLNDFKEEIIDWDIDESI